MRIRRCTIVALLLVTAAVLPGLALAADTGDQTSDPFLPGNDFTEVLENVQNDELLQWRWSSNQDPDFMVVGPNGTTYTKPFYGIAYVGNESGDWTFVWTNNNLAGQIMVDYRLRSFSVRPVIVSPEENTTIHSRTLELEGTCHPDLASLEYTTDNVSFLPVMKSGSTWNADVPLEEGRNHLLLRFRYSYYGQNYTGYKLVNYTVSTFWINWDNPGSLGVGSLMMIILIVLAAVLLILIRVARRRKKSQQLVQQAQRPELVPVQEPQVPTQYTPEFQGQPPPPPPPQPPPPPVQS